MLYACRCGKVCNVASLNEKGMPVITKEQYIEFLVRTPNNYTCTYFADHFDGITHDSVNDFLQNQRLGANSVWLCAKQFIHASEESFLIIDDSVQEKPHARTIEMVNRHYSGNKHRVVNGITIVNVVHSSGDGTYYPIDYRIYAPDCSAKTKNDYFLEMLKDNFDVRQVKSRYVLFDSWYGSAKNIKYIHRAGRFFFTTLKSNRLVRVHKETGYVHLDTLTWTKEQVRTGISIRLKEVPFAITRFKMVAKNGDIDWVITNEADSDLTIDIARSRNAVRWNIECFHREFKQLTGSEKCQCQREWAQRNHSACCYHAWLALKAAAVRAKQTLYRVRSDVISCYLKRELEKPTIRAIMYQ